MCVQAIDSQLSSAALMFCLFVAGCETAPPQMIYVSPDMLPESNIAKPLQKPVIFANQILVIAPVTGVGASNLQALSGSLGIPGSALIWGQTFHEALFKTLADSGMFGEVSRQNMGRYVLHSDILQQSTVGYGASFKVQYVLSDTQTGRDLWKQDITTTYEFPGSLGTFVTPYNTQLDALMRASGKNIGNLIRSLSAIQPNHSAIIPKEVLP